MKTLICWFLANLRVPATLGFFGGMLGYFLAVAPSASESNPILDPSTGAALLFANLLISICIATWAARFAYQNFDEVWSRRMRWSNSKVDKLEKRVKYSIKIWFQSLASGMGIIGIPLLLLYSINWGNLSM